MDSDNILETNDNDVVSGRGSGGNRHPGNIYFRELIKSNKAYYLSLGKNQKMDVARAIYDKISSLDPPGRFLNKNPETDKWFVIKKDRALEKISQALREKPSVQRKGRLPISVPDFDHPAFLLPRGMPLPIAVGESSDNLYSSASQIRNSFNPMNQNQEQLSMAQKLQYQNQLKMMDIMQTGIYSGSLPQPGVFSSSSVSGPSFGLFPQQYPMNGAGYVKTNPFTENSGYPDRMNFSGVENQIMPQSQQIMRSGFSSHPQASFSGNNMIGMYSTNSYASVPMSDYQRVVMSGRSNTSGNESSSSNRMNQHTYEVSVQTTDGPRKMEMVLPTRDSVNPDLHQIKEPISAHNPDGSNTVVSN